MFTFARCRCLRAVKSNAILWQNVTCRNHAYNFLGRFNAGVAKLALMATTIASMYRVGNRNAGLDRIRSQDVTICSDPAETEICVRASNATDTPGISCWTTQQAAANVARRGRTWELPAGATYDDARLRLWQPRPDKWYWSPARNMRGSDFITALRAVNAQFQ